MKKGIVFFSLILFCFVGFAKELGTSWVMTSDGKMDCKKIHLGYKKARIVLGNGEKVSIGFSNISSFSFDNQVFIKLPLYEGNKPTGKMAFMQFIKTWNDLSLYKLAIHDLYSPGVQQVSYNYYLYEGKNYFLQLDDRSLQNTCEHFGLNKTDL